MAGSRTGGAVGGRKKKVSAANSCQRKDGLNCATIVRKAKQYNQADIDHDMILGRDEDSSLSFKVKRVLGSTGGTGPKPQRSNKPGTACKDIWFDAQSYPKKLSVRIYL